MSRTIRKVTSQRLFNISKDGKKYHWFLEQQTINGNMFPIEETMTQLNMRYYQGKYCKAANIPSRTVKGYNGCGGSVFASISPTVKKRMKQHSSSLRRCFSKVALLEGLGDYYAEQEEKQQEFYEYLNLEYYYADHNYTDFNEADDYGFDQKSLDKYTDHNDHSDYYDHNDHRNYCDYYDYDPWLLENYDDYNDYGF